MRSNSVEGLLPKEKRGVPAVWLIDGNPGRACRNRYVQMPFVSNQSRLNGTPSFLSDSYVPN